MTAQTTEAGLVLPEEGETAEARREQAEADARTPTRYVVLVRVIVESEDGKEEAVWREVTVEDGATRRGAYSKIRERAELVPTEEQPEVQLQMVPERSWQPITRTRKVREPEIVDEGV